MSKELTAEAVEVLKKATVDGMVVKLPTEKLDRKVYLEVAVRLELIGGKWKGGKIFGFVFQEDPTELLEQISNGEKRNLKKEYQFFGTSEKNADNVVFEAQIEPFHKILEPSAGQGALIKAMRRVFPDIKVDYCELMPINQSLLSKLPSVNFICDDFLTCNKYEYYDRIIANPPFNKNQDVEHIFHMYKMLKPGGRLVSFASKHWQHSSNKREQVFKAWLGQVGYDIIEVPAGEFKESGTNIATCIIIINKPA